jgi:uncharacterized membrane protein
MISNITGSALKFNWRAGALVYVLIALGITAFVLPQAETVTEALKYGALFGLVVYGVYDLTNVSIFGGYDVGFALADITWGVFVSAVTSAITFKIIS